MGHLDTIKKTAQKLITLCEKEKQTKTDKARMLKIHAELLESIENLAECELCGTITEMIVTMTLVDVTAELCKTCGIKSLEVGKIQNSKQGGSRKRTARTKKPAAKTAESKSKTGRTTAKRAAPAEEPESPAALHTRIEARTGIKKADVKRIHRIVQNIAAPMKAEHTLTYVQREAEIAKIRVDAGALAEAVTLLTHPDGAQGTAAA